MPAAFAVHHSARFSCVIDCYVNTTAGAYNCRGFTVCLKGARKKNVQRHVQDELKGLFKKKESAVGRGHGCGKFSYCIPRVPVRNS